MIKHVTETDWPKQVNNLYTITCEYIQEPDNYSPDSEYDNKLIISTAPGGYFYIKTERWAFDDIEELLNVINDFRNKVVFAHEGNQNNTFN